jgi:predicted amino acid-binding ACT domain protein
MKSGALSAGDDGLIHLKTFFVLDLIKQVFEVFNKNNVNVQMISQGASKVNISMVVDDAEAESLVIQLHKVFFPELESDGNKVIVKGILQ